MGNTTKPQLPPLEEGEREEGAEGGRAKSLASHKTSTVSGTSWAEAACTSCGSFSSAVSIKPYFSLENHVCECV